MISHFPPDGRLIKCPPGMAKASVNSILRDHDRESYFDLIRKPRTTVEDAHQWLVDRGYKVSRVAVRNHFQSASEEGNLFLGMPEDAQRELIHNAAAQIKGAALANLTRYAVYLAGEAAKREGIKRLPPTAPGSRISKESAPVSQTDGSRSGAARKSKGRG